MEELAERQDSQDSQDSEEDGGTSRPLLAEQDLANLASEGLRRVEEGNVNRVSSAEATRPVSQNDAAEPLLRASEVQWEDGRRSFLSPCC